MHLISRGNILRLLLQALFRHEVLIQVIRPAVSASGSLRSQAQAPRLLRDRPLVEIARLEELVRRGEPVLYFLLLHLR